MGEKASVLLSTFDLAERADFRFGEAAISPSTHYIRGPGGETSVEPLIMQVLLALCDAEGRVVSREALFKRCWGNVTVGEDSLNRIIAETRRITRTIAPGSFAIETIRRTGYSLVARTVFLPAPSFMLPHPSEPSSAGQPQSRRWVVTAGAAGAVALATGGAG